MTLNKQPSDGRPAGGSDRGSSRSFIVVIAIIVVLALGYTLVRTIANPVPKGNQTASPTK